MRVLIVHGYIGPGGGAETAIRNEIKALALQGIEARSTHQNPFLCPELLDDIDFIHFHTIHNEMGLTPLVEARKQGIPHCISLHDYWGFCSSRMLLTVFDSECGAVVGVCSNDCWLGHTSTSFREQLYGSPTVAFCRISAEILNRNGIKITTIIPHGIDTDFFSPPEGGGRQWDRIVTVAAWASNPAKGMHVFRKALDINGRAATLITNQSHEQVREALRQAGIFVFPSVYQETFGLSLVEAMSCGCACISSDVAGPMDIITTGHNGIIVPRRDAKALAEAIDMLCNDSNLCEKLGQAARATVLERYTLALYGYRLQEFFASLC